MAEKPDIDLHLLEFEYRKGIKTLRAIAADFGVSEGQVRKLAKKYGWARDLSARINEKAAELVRKEAVRKSVRKSESAYITESEVVKVTAEQTSEILIGHKSSISRARKLGDALLEELESQTFSCGDYKEMLDMMAANDYERLAGLCQKVISNPARVDSLRKLAETLKTLIGLERQALNIDDNANGDANSPEDAIQAIIMSAKNNVLRPDGNR